jgi:hypothetical protein
VEAKAPQQNSAGSTDTRAGQTQAAETKAESRAELFQGWPKPQAALVITGNQHGYLEPCGCTGLAHQKGGLARRHSLIQQLAEKGWNPVPLDAGNQVRRIGPQAELQFQATANALKTMGYKAVGLGNEDLQLSELLGSVASTEEGEGPFLSANVALADRGFLPRHMIVKVGGRTIGITAVMGDALRKSVTNGDAILEEVDAGLREPLAAFDEAKCDFRVLLAFTSPEDAKEIAQRHKAFNLVVASSGPMDPSYRLEEVDGSTASLIHTGVKGMYAMVVGLYDDPKQPIRYERVPLDDRFKDSKAMREVMAGYQSQLEQLGLEGLGLKPQRHPSGRTFVGTETCGECHTKAMAVWEKTAHAHATDTLVHPGERSDIPRQHDPECLSCHVTGWEPQKFLPLVGGYLSIDKTPLLKQNGCENCHGPGSEHVAAENNTGGKWDETSIAKARVGMRLPLANKVAERKCMECHDIDNSPDFHAEGAFERYWKEVEHRGKD